MNLLSGETQPAIPKITPLLSDETTPNLELRHWRDKWSFVPIVDDDTTLPLLYPGAYERALLGTGPLAFHTFTVRFKPHGGETSLDRYFVGFMEKLTRRTIKAADQCTQKEKNRGAVALLNSWLNTDEETDAEHRETLDYLIKTLDEDRPSYRKLFP